MDSENHRKVFHQRVGGVQRAQQHGNQRGLPVVAVDYIGGPDMLSDFNRSAAEFAVTLGVVGIFSRATAINSVAVEVAGIVDKKVAHTVEHGAVGDGRKTQASSQRDGHAGHNHHARFYSAVTRSTTASSWPCATR